MIEVTVTLRLGGQQLGMDYDPETHTQLDVIHRALEAIAHFPHGEVTVGEKAEFIDKALRSRNLEIAKRAFERAWS
jgi:hypothetical protein